MAGKNGEERKSILEQMNDNYVVQIRLTAIEIVYLVFTTGAVALIVVVGPRLVS